MTSPRALRGDRFTEEFIPAYRNSFQVKSVLKNYHTGHQHLLLFENPWWGKVLVLDGAVQLTEKDEFFYHEALVHPPLVLSEGVGSVLILGGGDGCALREVLKHPVREVLLVDLDEEVVETCRRFLSPLNGGAFDDPRVRVKIEDAFLFLRKCRRKFSTIVVDLTDPIGPASTLQSEEFLIQLNRALKKDGMAVMQSGSPLMKKERMKGLWERAKHIFPGVWVYLSPVPSYPGGLWSFLLLSPRPPESIDLRRAKRKLQRIPHLSFLTHAFLTGIFEAPGFIKREMR